jgi:hypothetical protein
MRYRYLRIAIFVACVIAAFILIIAVSRRTTSADREWLLTATRLHLEEPDLILEGPALQQLLSEYVLNTKSKYLSLSYPMERREGKITIDGEEYPARFVLDKFSWNVLYVDGHWKTIKLRRSSAEFRLPKEIR